jgi:SAM-dependent methyltransferase
MENIFNKKYIIKNGIIKFDINDTIVKKNIEFYSKTPFPNYTKLDDKFSILDKGNKNYLTREFKKYIGYNKKILEVGCGTGQSSLYFAIGNNNKVFALDPTLESIKLGLDFAKKNNIENVLFVNADIFEDIFRHEVFDFIWTNGVLHHTKNPSLAFDIISKYLKKEGYILVGLYNKYGRLRTVLRRFLYKIFGNFIVKILDPSIRRFKKGNDLQVNAWIKDQYEHPKESLHTLDEVLTWFKKNNIEFINSIPSCIPENSENQELFNKTSRGSSFTRLLSQIFMLFNNLGSDGGLFIVIGKKK